MLFSADKEALAVRRRHDKALIEASTWGNNELVEKLLKNGADIDATDTKYQNTALHWAAYRNHLDLVKLLINMGATVDLRNKFGSTPLFWAARRGGAEIVKFLLDSEAEVDARDNDRKTPLMVAAAAGQMENAATSCDGRSRYQCKKQLRMDAAHGSLL